MSVKDLEKDYGFTIGAANTEAAAAPVVVEYDDELVAQIEALVAKAHTETKTGKKLKTSDGRPKAVLGKNDKIGGFTVIINGSK